MKLSKSKLALAKVINENGGWVDDSVYAANDECGIICGYLSKPIRRKTKSYHWIGSQRETWIRGIKTPQWHQCVLSREEYYQAYPNADADGWIEWSSSAKSPVSKGVVVDVKIKNGTQHFGQLIDDECWGDHWGDASIIAYRLHKPEVKPELCESVMRSIPDPEVNPTIEQLAQGYRNAKDYADRLQKEAGDAAVKAESFAVEIRKKILELQELIGISNPEPEPELVTTDWRDLMVGDDVECINDNIGNKYSGAVGVVREVDYDDRDTPVCVDIDGVGGIWCHDVKFIRRP